MQKEKVAKIIFMMKLALTIECQICLLPWEVGKNASPQKTYFPGGSDGYATYSTAWNLCQIHFGEVGTLG